MSSTDPPPPPTITTTTTVFNHDPGSEKHLHVAPPNSNAETPASMSGQSSLKLEDEKQQRQDDETVEEGLNGDNDNDATPAAAVPISQLIFVIVALVLGIFMVCVVLSCSSFLAADSQIKLTPFECLLCLGCTRSSKLLPSSSFFPSISLGALFYIGCFLTGPFLFTDDCCDGYSQDNRSVPWA